MSEQELQKLTESYGADLCNYCRECDKGKTNPCVHRWDAMFGYKDGLKKMNWKYIKSEADLPEERTKYLVE